MHNLEVLPAAGEIVERVGFRNSFPKSFPRDLSRVGVGEAGAVDV